MTPTEVQACRIADLEAQIELLQSELFYAKAEIVRLKSNEHPREEKFP